MTVAVSPVYTVDVVHSVEPRPTKLSAVGRPFQSRTVRDSFIELKPTSTMAWPGVANVAMGCEAASTLPRSSYRRLVNWVTSLPLVGLVGAVVWVCRGCPSASKNVHDARYVDPDVKRSVLTTAGAVLAAERV